MPLAISGPSSNHSNALAPTAAATVTIQIPRPNIAPNTAESAESTTLRHKGRPIGNSVTKRDNRNTPPKSASTATLPWPLEILMRDAPTKALSRLLFIPGPTNSIATAVHSVIRKPIAVRADSAKPKALSISPWNGSDAAYCIAPLPAAKVAICSRRLLAPTASQFLPLLAGRKSSRKQSGNIVGTFFAQLGTTIGTPPRRDALSSPRAKLYDNLGAHWKCGAP